MNYDNLKKFFTELTDIVYRERITVAVFVILFAIINLLSYLYSERNFSSKKLNVTIAEAFEKNQFTGETSIESDANFSSERYSFDPSSVSFDELLRLGFTYKAAKTLINYREKGGRFFKKEDVKKIYGVSSELYSKIESYIVIPSLESSSHYKNQERDQTPSIIDINHATAEEWKALPGIGEYFGNKFVAMRQGLGAFLSIDQLGETYGLPDSTFQKIKPYLKITKGTIKKINVNTASREVLVSNPYIMKWQADDILKNRPIYGLEDLYDLYTFKDKAKHKKLEPYLEF